MRFFLVLYILLLFCFAFSLTEEKYLKSRVSDKSHFTSIKNEVNEVSK